MKKITLFFITFLAFQFGNAQQTISFEASEGYTAGDINGQQGWVTIGDGTGGLGTNQIISTEDATEGTSSLKIVQETAFPGQANPIVGAFYNYSVPVSGTAAIFSADINMSQQDANSSDFIVGLVSIADGQFRTYIRFTFDGNIVALVDDGTGTVILDDTNVDWVANTWYNVKIDVAGSSLNFSIDDTVIYSGIPATSGDIDQVRFAHDNFEGFAYVDNFRTNDEPTAGVDEFASNVFTHSYNKQSDVLTINSSELAFNNIQLYNLLGQEVLNNRLSQTSENINLSQLQDGIYMARVMIGSQFQTLKFIKQ